MRVNVYAQEISERVEIVEKRGENGEKFYGVRIYTELPVTTPLPGKGGVHQVKGPFIHHDGDDDSAAVTFWSLSRTKRVLEKAVKQINEFLES